MFLIRTEDSLTLEYFNINTQRLDTLDLHDYDLRAVSKVMAASREVLAPSGYGVSYSNTRMGVTLVFKQGRVEIYSYGVQVGTDNFDRVLELVNTRL